MTLKNVETPETNVRVLEFTLEKDAFEAAQMRAYRKNVGKITVPGFRRGKAPKSIIEKMYGKNYFYEEAINDLLPDAYEAAVKEAGLEVVSYPEFDITSIDENGVGMKAKVYVKPEVTLKAYKGLAAEKTVRPVTDADVDAEVERVRERNARLIEVTDRAAQDGDTVTIDYAGSVDGVPFEGGTAEKQPLKLGSGQFIPGFEEQVAGHKIGDEFDVNVKFPEEYHAEELSGKDAVFHCKLHEIKYNELPELDDEFAKDVSEFDTLDEYKKDIRAKMEKRNDQTAENVAEEQLIDALLANMEADIPEAMIDSEVENEVRNYDGRLRQQGLELSMYLKYTGMTLEQMKAQFRPQAEKQVKTRLALEKIAELENLTASEEELEKEYAEIAENYRMDVESVKAAIAAEDLAKDVRVRKAVELVKENAVITVKTEGEKAAKPKKTTAKKAAEKKEPADEKAEPASEAAAEKPAKKTTAKKKAPAKTEAPAEDAPAAEEKAPQEKKPAPKRTAKKAAPKDEGKTE